MIDTNNVLISSSEDGGLPVAIGFRAKKSNGKYRYFWLYRVKFGIPATNLETKGDSITFSTPTIEGTIMRRNKPDAEGRHPWKSEVTEGDAGVAQEVITGWYDNVYEPVFTPVSYTHLIAKEFGRRMGSKEEEAFLIGDGAGKPLGVFQSTGEMCIRDRWE